MVNFFRDFHRVFFQFKQTMSFTWNSFEFMHIIKLLYLFILFHLFICKILLHFCFSLHSCHMPFVNSSLHMLLPLLVSYHHLLTHFTFMLSISTTFFVIHFQNLSFILAMAIIVIIVIIDVLSCSFFLLSLPFRLLFPMLVVDRYFWKSSSY